MGGREAGKGRREEAMRLFIRPGVSQNDGVNVNKSQQKILTFRNNYVNTCLVFFIATRSPKKTIGVGFTFF